VGPVRPQGRRAIGLAGSALIAVLFILAAPTVLSYVTFLWREKTDALEWRLDYVYSCFLIYWLAVIVRAIDRFQWSCARRNGPSM